MSMAGLRALKQQQQKEKKLGAGVKFAVYLAHFGYCCLCCVCAFIFFFVSAQRSVYVFT